MSSSITNLADATRKGFVKLAPNGVEMFGTVIRSGRMNKTVTVNNISPLTLVNLGSRLQIQIPL